jgi:hypothetical protein
MKEISKIFNTFVAAFIFVNLVTCFLFISPTFGGGSTPWEEVSSRDGIKVETRLVEGNPLKQTRSESILEAPIEVVYEIISIPENWIKWYAFCGDSKTVQKTDENTLVMFLVGDLPFPFHDRAGCFTIKRELNLEEGTGLFEAILVPDSEDDQYGIDVLTEKKGYLRLLSGFGIFNLTRVGPNKTKVNFYAGGDAGVWLPSWLINLIAGIQPRMTVKKLRKEVKKEIYYEKIGLKF